jgi:excinuclease ABC subunit C
MVVFEDGLPRKSDYRRFVIRGFEGQNDVAAMHETIDRRFRRLLEERAESTSVDLGVPDDERGPVLVDPDTGRPRKFAYAPGLVVVDGGPPQVAAAQRALDELGVDDVPVVGLAKRLEEVWRPGQEDPVILARTSEALYLLQRVRDEAHRFAITHHRNRRSKSMVESVLDDVPGLGEVRRKVLLRHFGSLKKLRAASVDDIAALPGFGRRSAESIAGALAATRRSAAPAVNTATGEILDDGAPDDAVTEGDEAITGEEDRLDRSATIDAHISVRELS